MKILYKKSNPTEGQQSRYQRQFEENCRAFVELYKGCPQSRVGKLPHDIVNAVTSSTIKELGRFKLSWDNFAIPLERLLRAEEITEQISLRRYDQNARMVRVDTYGKNKANSGKNNNISRQATGKREFNCAFNGLADGVISLVPGDQLVILDENRYKLFKIIRIKGDLVCFRDMFGNGVNEFLEVPKRYQVSFIHSGMNYERCLAAVKRADTHETIKNMLFPPTSARESPVDRISYIETRTDMLSDRLQWLDSRQKRAIRRMIEFTSYPYAYLVFGPPGTGKTTVLEEAVVQIYLRNPNAKLLVCSSSSVCVDDIAENLHETGLIDDMARFSSANYPALKAPNYWITTPADASKCRLIITSNLMADRISGSFDYVFIDEAGHSTIPETLIPATKLQPGGLLVLAGDPKQLCPLVRNHTVARLGLDISMLEHISNCDIYEGEDMYAQQGGDQHKEQDKEQYFSTKLINSYRSDKRIMKVVNKLFYRHLLMCELRTPQELLDKLQLSHPLVFLPVQGDAVQPRESSSFLNHQEAVETIDYLFKLYQIGLKPNQVGIITPYKLQKSEIIKEFYERIEGNKSTLESGFDPDNKVDSTWKQNNNKGRKKQMGKKNLPAGRFTRPPIDSAWLCKIDTVDAFQGGEREVILVSTVRTPDEMTGRLVGTGFLIDEARFNVTMSRAKHLIVVLGHPIMKSIRYWKDYCELAAKGAAARAEASQAN